MSSIKTTNSYQRINFASIKKPFAYPDFLEVQLKSFQDFLQLDTPTEKRKNEGLFKVFAENFPIADTRNNFVLEFLDYYVDPPRYTIEECVERGLTYSVPLKAKMKLYCTDPDHEDFDTVIQDVYLGPIPYMTPKGTFVINGAERVVVSQLHRSPGVFFGQSTHSNGTKLYSARIIPFKGSWIEFATDISNVMYAYIDRKKKLPVTTLLRAIGFESDKDILEIFNLAEEIKVNTTNLKKSVGRKLAARVLKTWVEDFVDEDTGEVVSIERNEVLIDRETVIGTQHIDEILESGVQTVLLHREDQNLSDYAIIYNTLQKDPSNSERDAVVYIYRQLRNADPADDASAREVIQNLFFSEKRYDLGDVGRYRINKKLNLTTSGEVKVLTKEDIIEIIKYLIELINSKANVDDIDHLSNRRVRTVGEQLYNQFGVGLSRMSRTIRERMNVRDNEVFTPIDLINAKTISSVVNSFFGTNALSQFMDQTNPLAEITHKRRMSALGPGLLVPEFSPDIFAYTLQISNKEKEFTIETESSSAEAKVSGTGTYNPDIYPTVVIKVTAEGGNENIYTLTVDRFISDATLKSLTLNNGAIPLRFRSDIFEYRVEVEDKVADITIGGEANHPEATVSGRGPRSLNYGENTFQVTVRAEDTEIGIETSETYTVTVHRISNDPALKSLTIAPAELVPPFDPDITQYTASVSHQVSSIAIEIETNYPPATGLVSNGDDFGEPGIKPLNVGQNVFGISVFAENKKYYRAYWVRITRGATPTGFHEAGTPAALHVYTANGRLHVDTPAAERINIYSVTGTLLYSFDKPAGAFRLSAFSFHPASILIVKGSSGWVRKVMM